MLTVSQVAQAGGVTAKAVRLYEARGLLPTAERTAAGYRMFDEADVDTVRFIRRSRALGLGLDAVETILTVHRAGACPCEHTAELIDQRIAEIDHTMRELSELRSTLLSVSCGRRYGACRGEETISDPAVICPVIEQG